MSPKVLRVKATKTIQASEMKSAIRCGVRRARIFSGRIGGSYRRPKLSKV